MESITRIIEMSPWLLPVLLSVVVLILGLGALLLYRAIVDGREVNVLGVEIGADRKGDHENQLFSGQIHDDPNGKTIFLDRHEIDWTQLQNRVSHRYWACGTSLISVIERDVVPNLIEKNISDIKVLLPNTDNNMMSFHQLEQYDYFCSSRLVYGQVLAAKKSYSKLDSRLSAVAPKEKLAHLRLYGGVMYSNITIFDDVAFVSYYDDEGVGDNNITLCFNKDSNPVAYQKIEKTFLRMWESGREYGRISRNIGTSIIFFRSPNQVLLLLRDNKESIPYPGCWDLPGGNLEEEETPLECITREMKEEIEFTLNCPSLFNVYDFPDRVEYTYWQFANFEPDSINLHEGQRLKWFSEEEIRTLPENEIAFNFKRVIIEFFSKKPFDCNASDASNSANA